MENGLVIDDFSIEECSILLGSVLFSRAALVFAQLDPKTVYPVYPKILWFRKPSFPWCQGHKLGYSMVFPDFGTNPSGALLSTDIFPPCPCCNVQGCNKTAHTRSKRWGWWLPSYSRYICFTWCCKNSRRLVSSIRKGSAASCCFILDSQQHVKLLEHIRLVETRTIVIFVHAMSWPPTWKLRLFLRPHGQNNLGCLKAESNMHRD